MKPNLYIKIIFLISLVFFLIPFLAGAITIENPLKYTTFEEIINAIIDFIFWVAIVIAPIAIIVAAFYFITSGGNPEQINKAKKIILFAFIGLLIVFSGRGIISLIREIIGGGGPAPGPSCGNGVLDPGEQCDSPQDAACPGQCQANCTCPPLPTCPNGSCDVAGGECGICPADCAVVNCCGNGVCDAAVGENNANCPADCPLVCVPTAPLCNGVCPPACTVAQDPDCPPCQGNNGCCGIGCLTLNDNDCGLTSAQLQKLGDINKDGSINNLDAIKFAAANGSTPLSPNWNPDADLNGDNIVNNLDLAILQQSLNLGLKKGDPLPLASLRKLGDINKSCEITDFDSMLMQAANGSTPLSPNWNPDADLNGDNIVNNLDKAILDQSNKLKLRCTL